MTGRPAAQSLSVERWCLAAAVACFVVGSEALRGRQPWETSSVADSAESDAALDYVFLELKNRLVDMHGYRFGSKGYQLARIKDTRRRLLGFARAAGQQQAAAANKTSGGGSLANLETGGSILTGTYYVEIGLGQPQQWLKVTFDTGSSVLWVNCDCISCPTSSKVITLTEYKPEDSSKSSDVACDANCQELQASNYGTFFCSAQQQCQFQVKYGDGSTVTGPVKEDQVSLPATTGGGGNGTGNGTAAAGPKYIQGQVYLGCGRQQSGMLTQEAGALDGLLGMGQSPDSMLGQLAQQKVLPDVFSFCLDSSGVGSHAILGRGPAPANVLKMPLVKNPAPNLIVPYYYVGLQKISVGSASVLGSEQMGAISAETGAGGVIVDSGTTITNLPEAVYQNLVIAMNNASPFPFDTNNQQNFPCVQLSSNDVSGFPDIVMHFAQGEWRVKPTTYLLLLGSGPFGPYLYCLGAMSGKAGKPAAIIGESWVADSFVQIDSVGGTFSVASLDCKSGAYFGASAVAVPGPPGYGGGGNVFPNAPLPPGQPQTPGAVIMGWLNGAAGKSGPRRHPLAITLTLVISFILPFLTLTMT